MEEHEIGGHCGDNAQRWAEQFCERFPEMDEGLMLGWFANAIEVSADWRKDRACPTPYKLSGSEAVYGFAAWLTTRDEATVFSAHNDAASIADLVKLFCETNDLSDPSENWTDALTHPKETTDD